MVKILTSLVIVISTLLSKNVLPEVKPKKEKDKKEVRQFIYSNSIHYPYFDFKKKKLDDE